MFRISHQLKTLSDRYTKPLNSQVGSRENEIFQTSVHKVKAFMSQT